MKKVLIIFTVLVLIVVLGIYRYRYELFQTSAEKIIMANLPNYVKIERIIFNLKGGEMIVKKLEIRNPAGYADLNLATVETITCKYKMRGVTILSGIEVTEITAEAPVIYLERNQQSGMNVSNMNQVMVPEAGTEASTPVETSAPAKAGKKPPKVDISKLIKLPEQFFIKNGKVIFSDSLLTRGGAPYVLTFEDVNGQLGLTMNENYTKVLSLSSSGKGFVNNMPYQSVAWDIYVDPTSEKLTMNSNFKLQTVDLLPFKPYYDQYAPVDITSGAVSGTLVFNFDNGNIDSQNTLKLNNLSFYERPESFASGFWQVAITDIIKYLQNSTGEIVFDFGITGDMTSPKFYPGPYVTQAIQNMVVDKVSDVIKQISNKGEGAAGSGNSDIDTAVSVIKGFLKN